MKIFPSLLAVSTAMMLTAVAEPQPLFDGKSFAGWEGDTAKLWKIENGIIIGSTEAIELSSNEFLSTTEVYRNFVLRVKFKLEGTGENVNSGVQFRSIRIPGSPRMRGYQADIGKDYYGCLYDELRRNKVLATADQTNVLKIYKPGDWNDYEIRVEGSRIILKLNGVQTVDYTETAPNIPQLGQIGLQLHAGGKMKACFKDITIEKLP